MATNRLKYDQVSSANLDFSPYYRGSLSALNLANNAFTNAGNALLGALETTANSRLQRDIAAAYDPNNLSSINLAIKNAATSPDYTFASDDVWRALNTSDRIKLNESLNKDNLLLAQRIADDKQAAVNLALSNGDIPALLKANQAAAALKDANGNALRTDAYRLGNADALRNSAATRANQAANTRLTGLQGDRLEREFNENDLYNQFFSELAGIAPTQAVGTPAYHQALAYGYNLLLEKYNKLPGWNYSVAKRILNDINAGVFDKILARGANYGAKPYMPELGTSQATQATTSAPETAESTVTTTASTVAEQPQQQQQQANTQNATQNIVNRVDGMLSIPGELAPTQPSAVLVQDGSLGGKLVSTIPPRPTPDLNTYSGLSTTAPTRQELLPTTNVSQGNATEQVANNVNNLIGDIGISAGGGIGATLGATAPFGNELTFKTPDNLKASKTSKTSIDPNNFKNSFIKAVNDPYVTDYLTDEDYVWLKDYYDKWISMGVFEEPALRVVKEMAVRRANANDKKWTHDTERANAALNQHIENSNKLDSATEFGQNVTNTIKKANIKPSKGGIDLTTPTQEQYNEEFPPEEFQTTLPDIPGVSYESPIDLNQPLPGTGFIPVESPEVDMNVPLVLSTLYKDPLGNIKDDEKFLFEHRQEQKQKQEEERRNSARKAPDISYDPKADQAFKSRLINAINNPYVTDYLTDTDYNWLRNQHESNISNGMSEDAALANTKEWAIKKANINDRRWAASKNSLDNLTNKHIEDYNKEIAAENQYRNTIINDGLTLYDTKDALNRVNSTLESNTNTGYRSTPEQAQEIRDNIDSMGITWEFKSKKINEVKNLTPLEFKQYLIDNAYTNVTSKPGFDNISEENLIKLQNLYIEEMDRLADDVKVSKTLSGTTRWYLEEQARKAQEAQEVERTNTINAIKDMSPAQFKQFLIDNNFEIAKNPGFDSISEDNIETIKDFYVEDLINKKTKKDINNNLNGFGDAYIKPQNQQNQIKGENKESAPTAFMDKLLNSIIPAAYADDAIDPTMIEQATRDNETNPITNELTTEDLVTGSFRPNQNIPNTAISRIPVTTPTSYNNVPSIQNYVDNNTLSYLFNNPNVPNYNYNDFNFFNNRKSSNPMQATASSSVGVNNSLNTSSNTSTSPLYPLSATAPARTNNSISQQTQNITASTAEQKTSKETPLAQTKQTVDNNFKRASNFVDQAIDLTSNGNTNRDNTVARNNVIGNINTILQSTTEDINTGVTKSLETDFVADKGPSKTVLINALAGLMHNQDPEAVGTIIGSLTDGNNQKIMSLENLVKSDTRELTKQINDMYKDVGDGEDNLTYMELAKISSAIDRFSRRITQFLPSTGMKTGNLQTDQAIAKAIAVGIVQNSIEKNTAWGDLFGDTYDFHEDEANALFDKMIDMIKNPNSLVYQASNQLGQAQTIQGYINQYNKDLATLDTTINNLEALQQANGGLSTGNQYLLQKTKQDRIITSSLLKKELEKLGNILPRSEVNK